jgi:hypothetical protein
MRDAGGQESPMAVVCSWRERERERERMKHIVLVRYLDSRKAHWSKQKERDATEQ